MTTFAAIDFETADHGYDSACAVGAVLVRNGRIDGTYQQLIRPPRKRFVFTHIHGLAWNDVRDSPTFGEMWSDLRDFLDDAEFLVAHNASFDRKVLHACCAASDVTPPGQAFRHREIGPRQVEPQTGTSSGRLQASWHPPRSPQCALRRAGLREDRHQRAGIGVPVSPGEAESKGRSRSNGGMHATRGSRHRRRPEDTTRCSRPGNALAHARPGMPERTCQRCPRGGPDRPMIHFSRMCRGPLPPNCHAGFPRERCARRSPATGRPGTGSRGPDRGGPGSSVFESSRPDGDHPPFWFGIILTAGARERRDRLRSAQRGAVGSQHEQSAGRPARPGGEETHGRQVQRSGQGAQRVGRLRSEGVDAAMLSAPVTARRPTLTVLREHRCKPWLLCSLDEEVGRFAVHRQYGSEKGSLSPEC